MAKFVNVKEAPEALRDGEYLVNMPTFIEEIKKSNARTTTKPRLITANNLRAIAGLIASAYDHDFDPFRNLHPHAYEGREYSTPEDVSAIVLEMLDKDYPLIFDKYLDHQIKKRPFGTKLIYFTGPHNKTAVFYSNGIDRIEEKDVDTYLGLKAKKVVGKPAVTSEDV